MCIDFIHGQRLVDDERLSTSKTTTRQLRDERIINSRDCDPLNEFIPVYFRQVFSTAKA